MHIEGEQLYLLTCIWDEDRTLTHASIHPERNSLLRGVKRLLLNIVDSAIELESNAPPMSSHEDEEGNNTVLMDLYDVYNRIDDAETLDEAIDRYSEACSVYFWDYNILVTALSPDEEDPIALVLGEEITHV